MVSNLFWIFNDIITIKEMGYGKCQSLFFTNMFFLVNCGKSHTKRKNLIFTYRKQHIWKELLSMKYFERFVFIHVISLSFHNFH